MAEFFSSVTAIGRPRRALHGAGVHEAYETEALSQGVIVDTVRTRLAELLPDPLDEIVERETQPKALLRYEVDP